MTSPIDAPWALSYRVPIGHESLNRFPDISTQRRTRRRQ